MTALCLCAWTIPLSLLSSVINTAFLNRQARYSTSSSIQVVHLGRELVLQDGFSRLTAQQLAADLYFARNELATAVQRMRLGGGRVRTGLDDLESPVIDEYKRLMYQVRNRARAQTLVPFITGFGMEFS